MSLETNPRKLAILTRARQFVNQQVSLSGRATFSRHDEADIVAMLSLSTGTTLDSAVLAYVDTRNKAYIINQRAEDETQALYADPSKTFEDWVDPSTDTSGYTRPAFWTGQPFIRADGSYSDPSWIPSLAYSKITNAPSIPAAQVQSDYTQVNTGAVDFIKNKPALFNGTFSALTGKPTTLSGYGITDAYPLAGNPSAFLTTITSGQITTALGFTPYNATNPSSYITQAGARTAVTLTTTGTGSATYNSGTGVLNVPTPTLTGGTVTSVGLTMPSGLSIAGSPVTGSGTLAVTTTLNGIVQGNGSGFSVITVGTTLTFSGGSLAVSQATATPLGPGVAAVGTSVKSAKEDHVHPLPTGINTLIGTVTVAESGITVSLGVRRVNVAVAGVVTGGNYMAFATAALTAGYSIQDCFCGTNGTLTVALLVPALVIGSYSFSLRIVQLGT